MHCVFSVTVLATSLCVLLVTAILGGVVLARVSVLSTSFQALDPNKTWPLPARFLVPDHARTPVKNQASRGTCYIFSTMSFLEASYKKYGFEKGYLKEDEYVKFSEQAYGVALVKYCQEHPEEKLCFAGPALNKTADGEAEWLYYFRDILSPYVLPDAVCPYKTTDEGQFDCPGLEEAAKKNPFKFEVKELKTAYNVEQIKRLMYEKKTPLTWSHSVVAATYTIPCDDESYSLGSSEQCVQCYHPCKESSTGCCAEHKVSGYDNQGIFSIFDKAYINGGHAMTAVGWNDNFVVQTGIPGERAHTAKGGFIIKNSWDHTVGHSAEYWAQEHSVIDENYICPCEASSHTWIPAEKACMLEKKSATECSTQYKNVRKEWMKGATVLKCTSTALNNKESALLHGFDSCDESKNYVLANVAGNNQPWVTYPAGSNGMMQFHLIEFDPNDATAEAKLITTNATTYFGIERLLTPVTLVGNSKHCGYYFFPYETFEISLATYPVTGHDPVGASYFDIKWEKSSYNKKNDLIKNSLYTHSYPHFDGPFDVYADV